MNDARRTDLAAEQFADSINYAGGCATLDKVLDMSRRKSGNYTVRRPFKRGAAMAERLIDSHLTRALTVLDSMADLAAACTARVA